MCVCVCAVSVHRQNKKLFIYLCKVPDSKVVICRTYISRHKFELICTESPNELNSIKNAWRMSIDHRVFSNVEFYVIRAFGMKLLFFFSINLLAIADARGNVSAHKSERANDRANKPIMCNNKFNWCVIGAKCNMK